MKIYNTLTRTKQEFQTQQPNKVKMYACGPTVYDFMHIGNARPVILFDVLRRYFEYKGYDVSFVQNFTDVDNKIIDRALKQHCSAEEIAKRYIEEYFTDAKGLGVREATLHPKVTDNIEAIIKTVEQLVQKGYAYTVSGDVYFRTQRFADYGKLSQMPLEQLEAGARIATGEQKEHPFDFALWKSAKHGEPSWSSPWGEGRPGWHIECTAMAQKFLGETIDLHCGGQDLIFPHHENEIAQSEAISGKPFANFWMHNGHINVDNKKMSKSEGNFFTVREVAEKFGYEPIRFLMLQVQYRSPINYSLDLILQCKAALERLYQCKRLLDESAKTAVSGEISAEQQANLMQIEQQFIQAMEDDFNTADALASIFELVRQTNTKLSTHHENQKTKPTSGYLNALTTLFLRLTSVLGLLYTIKQIEIPQEVQTLVDARIVSKKEKDFVKADQLRDQITALGYTLQETRNGTRVIPIG